MFRSDDDLISPNDFPTYGEYQKEWWEIERDEYRRQCLLAELEEDLTE